MPLWQWSVTYDEEDVITSNDLTIELIPIWKWLLVSEM